LFRTNNKYAIEVTYMKNILNGYLNLLENKTSTKIFDQDEAKKIGDEIGVDWSKHNLTNFTKGLNVELEHGLKYPETNITNDDPIMTGKITYVHMREIPGTGKGDDYYSLLEKYVESNEG